MINLHIYSTRELLNEALSNKKELYNNWINVDLLIKELNYFKENDEISYLIASLKAKLEVEYL